MPLLVITHFYSYLTYIFHLAAFFVFNLSYSTTRKLRRRFFLHRSMRVPRTPRQIFLLYTTSMVLEIYITQLWVCLSLNPTSSNYVFLSIHTNIMWIVVKWVLKLPPNFRMHVLAAKTI